MRIPNKFNGYMSDGRRLYPDPATSAIMASALAKGTAVAAPTLAATTAAAAPTLTAAAVPGLVGSAAPALTGAIAPAATTAATNLGTTAALEASKQGIIQGGADVMAQEAAKQAAQETAKQGILQGNTAAQNQVLEAFSKPATDLSQYPQFVPEASNTASQLVPQASQAASPGVYNSAGQLTSSYAPNIPPPPGPTPTAPVGLQSATTPSPVNPGYESVVAKTKDVETAAKVGKEFEAAQAAEKYANMNPLEKGMFKAKELAGDIGQFAKDNQLLTTGGIMLAQNMMQPSYSQPAKKSYKGSGGGGDDSDFKYRGPSTSEYTPIFEPTPYAVGGPVEQMSAQNAMGSNMMYPQSQLQTPMYSNPMAQRPMPTNVINPSGDAGVNMYSGEPRMATGGKVSAFERMMKEEKERQEAQQEAAQAAIEKGKSLNPASKPYSRTQSTNTPYAAALKEFQALNKKYGIPVVAPAKTNIDLMGDQDQIEYAANGGIMHGLGGYSDGGRLLKGPGDGVSDSIPAVIGRKQPARLADGEFVIPARIVSELGNGSTEAGARKLYAMMERIQKQRGKTVGKGKVAVNSKASKHLPA